MAIQIGMTQQEPPFPEPPLPEPSQPELAQSHPPMVYVYEPQAWEYKTVVRHAGHEQLLSEQELNRLGGEGWELAGVASQPERVIFYFKRPRD